MPMSDGRYSLVRCAFIVENDDYSEDSRFDFAINPQQITENTQNRTAYLNTKDWGSIQNYGMGQKTLTIAGTTGWRGGLGIDDAWKLKAFLQRYQSFFPLDNANNRKWLKFANYTDDYTYQVELAPEGYQFTQDVSQPLLVRYNIQLICISDSNQANAGDRTRTVIGKPGEGGIDNGNVNSNTQMGAVGNAVSALKRDGR